MKKKKKKKKVSKITHNTSIKDLIMAEQTKDLEILTDSESLSLLCNAFTLRPEKFPDIKDVNFISKNL